MAMDLGAMRKAYRDGSDVLTEASLVADREPYAQFKAWFAEAEAHPGIYEANSMVLATASKDTAAPSARVVLLKVIHLDMRKIHIRTIAALDPSSRVSGRTWGRP